jgi:regulator of protease activity HflC (stomatin/prohibitin superfamily)
MRLGFVGGLIAVIAVILLIVGYSSLFQVYQTRQALVVRLGNPLRVVTQPGLHVKMPLLDTVIYVDKRILDLENSSQEVIAADQKQLIVDASRAIAWSTRSSSTRRSARSTAQIRGSRPSSTRRCARRSVKRR